MNKQQTQIISYLLTASLLLSFWICVEECQTEIENDSQVNVSVSENIRVENTDKDSCSVQAAPLVIFFNQKLFTSTNSSTFPHQTRKAIFQHKFAPVLSGQNEKTFIRLPLQILHQLRI